MEDPAFYKANAKPMAPLAHIQVYVAVKQDNRGEK